MSNAKIAAGLMIIITGAASFPYFVRTAQTETTIGSQKKLTGSQRQRGMWMNGGSSDAGPDPDYDAATGTWHGHTKRAAQRAAAAERNAAKEGQ
jgi:hypothetical protein